MPSAVALIPARQGSKRVPGKNVRLLHGHPMLAYTIAAAIESSVFDAVIVVGAGAFAFLKWAPALGTIDGLAGHIDLRTNAGDPA